MPKSAYFQARDYKNSLHIRVSNAVDLPIKSKTFLQLDSAIMVLGCCKRVCNPKKSCKVPQFSVNMEVLSEMRILVS